MKQGKKTIEYYDNLSNRYVEQTIQADMLPTIEKFLYHIPKQGTILDLGCGSGRDSLYFINQGYNVTAVDGSSAMCKLATDLIGKDVRHLTFQKLDYVESFDGVWACASLLHAAEKELPSILKKIATSIKPNGTLYASWKYGASERTEMVTGRFFCDMTEERIHELFSKIKSMQIVEVWTTLDVRNTGQTWINVLAKRVS